ncbi:MAG: hypothetical protein ACREJX_18750, partial [Polyangiaceae bacterium]
FWRPFAEGRRIEARLRRSSALRSRRLRFPDRFGIRSSSMQDGKGEHGKEHGDGQGGVDHASSSVAGSLLAEAVGGTVFPPTVFARTFLMPGYSSLERIMLSPPS